MHVALILYGGPDQLLPLTSGLAAAFAFLLIFWNKVMITLGKIGSFLRGSHRPAAELAPPAPEEQSDSAPRG
jgi:hypothetical protein